MTIIVYRDGVLAADDLISNMPDGNFSGRTVKIAYRKKDKCLIAACGEAAGLELFIRAALKGKEATVSNRDFVGVIARPDGLVEEWTGGAKCIVNADHYAVGWGSLVATGALRAGANAVEAARIVCAQYGWPADIHALNHDGAFELHERQELPLHENARSAVLEWDKRYADQPKRKRRARKSAGAGAKRSRSKAKRVRRPARKR